MIRYCLVIVVFYTSLHALAQKRYEDDITIPNEGTYKHIPKENEVFDPSVDGPIGLFERETSFDNKFGTYIYSYADSKNFDSDLGNRKKLKSQYNRSKKKIESPSYGIGFDESGTYYGHWVNNKKDGYGIEVMKDNKGREQIYEGEWKLDKKNGFGVQKFYSSDVYYGNWKDGKRDGEGIMLDSNSTLTVRTTWKNDRPSGKTVIKQNSEFKNLKTFVGEFARKGHAQFTSSNDEIYKGQVENGVPNGFGYFKYNETHTRKEYIGKFKNGKPSGYGKLEYKNGDIFEGDFLNGDINGHGRKISKNGKVEIGNWSSEKRNGVFYEITGNSNSPIFKEYVNNELSNIINQDVLKERFKEVVSDDFIKTISDYKSNLNEVGGRLEENLKNKSRDPIFISKEHFGSVQILGNTYLKGISEFQTRFFTGSAISKELSFAYDLKNNLNSLIQFSQGITNGLFEKTFLNVERNVKETFDLAHDLLQNPSKVFDAAVELYENISNGKVSDAVMDLIENKWEEFQDASPEKKGEMIQAVLAEAMADVISGAAISSLNKLAKGTKLLNSLNKVATKTVGYSKKQLKRNFDRFKKITGNMPGKTVLFSELTSKAFRLGYKKSEEINNFIDFSMTYLIRRPKQYAALDDINDIRKGLRPKKGDFFAKKLPDLEKKEHINSFGGKIYKGVLEPGEILYQARNIDDNKIGEFFGAIRPLNRAQAEDYWDLIEYQNRAERLDMFLVKERVSVYAGKINERTRLVKVTDIVDGKEQIITKKVVSGTGYQILIPHSIYNKKGEILIKLDNQTELLGF